jgi:hypothetical protein
MLYHCHLTSIIVGMFIYAYQYKASGIVTIFWLLHTLFSNQAFKVNSIPAFSQGMCLL